MEDAMYCTLTLDGVPVGQVDLAGAPRAVGFLSPLNGYVATGVNARAKRLGLALRLLGSSRIDGMVVARGLAAAVAQFADIQDRLTLIDIRGGHVAIIHIVVAEFPHDTVPVVVAELREQAAAVPALLELLASRSSDSARPAA
jgi:hypothetical protein